ncbi:MAG: PqqD family protein [Candidatus Eisenbacteria bacterium]
MSLGPDSVLKRSPSVPWRTIDRKGILVDLESGYYFSLNSTGQYIWGQLDGARSIREIARRVVEQFEVDEETALADCLELATRLLDQGLVVLVPA